ncbi:hypothetical protein LTR08_008053 [Meristemomyces frigidus]|nr:hypothetical protein LTR08_008053 [Meristemomyces frigidus]
MRKITFYGAIATLITVALYLFGTQGGPAFASDTYGRLQHQRPLPQSHGAPIAHSQSHIGPATAAWEFDYRRDGGKQGLSEEQCAAAFPELYVEVDRAVAYRIRVGNVTLDDLDVGWRGDGIVRARIYDNQLYIIDAHGVWDHNHRPRSIATLHALNRAISAAREPLPDIEFTFTDHDSALIDPNSNHTTWSYSRLAHQESLWLMPDFGFWAWPDVGLRSYRELQMALDYDEDDFLDKVPKLVWRGSLSVGSHAARVGLLEHSANQPWGDVQTLDWSNKSDIDSKLLTMEDHCSYMFTAQTEGNTYSGRLKYLLNCHSILLSHELQWIEHYHHLLRPAGMDQNYIKLKPDFRDLPKIMKNLLKLDHLLKAKTIADNARRTFRERYLTPAAEACYWRALVTGWASVQGFEPRVWEEREAADDWRGGKRFKKRVRGVPFESYVIMEEVDWAIPTKPRRVCIED